MSRSSFKAGLCLCLFLLIFPLSLPVRADNGYEITAYDVDLTVNEDNSFHIVETITADFTGANKHGILRTLPLRNTLKRLDGSSSTNHVRISNVSVNQPFTTDKENGEYVIKIGSADKVVSGEVTYVISYDYAIGRDPLKGADELYFNLIGNEWDTSIRRITFKITMPKSFDESRLGFSYGYYGDLQTDASLNYEVKGNVIQGSLNSLSAYQGLTVRLEMEEGYFVYQKTLLDYLQVLLYFMPLFSFAYVFMQWYRYGRDDKVIETVEFYPPEGLNPLDLKLYYAGSISSSDVTALLPYLAAKGYIDIYDNNTYEQVSGVKKLFANDRKDFEIVERAPYDGNNAEERLFCKGLFRKGSRVNYYDLYDHFYKTTDQIVERVNKRKGDVFSNLESQPKAYMMAVVSFLMVIFVPCIRETFLLLFPSGAAVIGGILMTTLFGKVLWKNLIALLVGLPLFAFGCLFVADYVKDYISYPFFFIAVAIFIGTLILARLMPKRTVRSNRLYGSILGFKNFLETAHKDQLEELVNEDPSYFYDILPYTYVLGVSDKWISKFDAINMREPDYYYGSYYDPYHFDHFMHETMNHTTDREVDDSSSGGGSGGGGGSSGGGSGGGGGSSW